MKNFTKALLLGIAVAYAGSALAVRNGSGTYNLPAGNPVNTGTPISSSWANNTLSDIAAALTQSIAKDGQTVPTANLPMGAFRHTSVGNATASNHYAAAGQVQDASLVKLGSVLGTNTITGSLTPAITSYSAGMIVMFQPANSSTGAVTLAINGLAALDVQKDDGDALVSGDLVAGKPALLLLDTGADDWILINPQSATLNNGVALSDLAQLSQANTFAVDQTITEATPQLIITETGVAADNGRWDVMADSEQLRIRARNDANSAGTNLLTADRTGTTVDSIAFTSTALTWNSNTLFTTANDGNGSGFDADLLDGLSAPAFGQLAVAADWSSTQTARSNNPSWRWRENDAGADEKIWEAEVSSGDWRLATRTDADAPSTTAIAVDRTGTTISGIALASTAITWNSNTLFTTANDGSGSGLDADLLDGLSSAAFATASHAHSAADVTSGTLAVARGGTGTTTSTGTGNVVLSASPTFSGTVTGGTFAGTHTGDGSGLTSLDAGDISAGTLAVARGGTGTTTSTGTGSVVLSASPTFTGTVTAATVAATTVTGNGSGLTALDAGDISAGTLAIARGGTGQTDGTARNITGKAGVAKTLSTSAASGGSDGDIWYRY